MKNRKVNNIFIFPLALVIIFFSSIIIIFSPISSKKIINTSPVITTEKALEMITNLPEVVKENQLLLAKKTKTTLYIEAEPTNTDQNFYIYYGEVQKDHQNRLVSFIVNSQTGEISVDTIVDPTPISYEDWQKSCQLESCSKTKK